MQALVEVAVFFSDFENLDLFSQGWYAIRLRVGGFKSPGAGSVLSASPNRVSTYDESSQTPADSPLSWQLDEAEGSYRTRTFRIRYTREQATLEEFVCFRVALDASEPLASTSLRLRFDLLFSAVDPATGGKLRRVSTQQLRLDAPVLGTHEYVPLHFDVLHLALVNLTVHSALLGYGESTAAGGRAGAGAGGSSGRGGLGHSSLRARGGSGAEPSLWEANEEDEEDASASRSSLDRASDRPFTMASCSPFGRSTPGAEPAGGRRGQRGAPAIAPPPEPEPTGRSRAQRPPRTPEPSTSAAGNGGTPIDRPSPPQPTPGASAAGTSVGSTPQTIGRDQRPVTPGRMRTPAGRGADGAGASRGRALLQAIGCTTSLTQAIGCSPTMFAPGGSGASRARSGRNYLSPAKGALGRPLDTALVATLLSLAGDRRRSLGSAEFMRALAASWLGKQCAERSAVGGRGAAGWLRETLHAPLEASHEALQRWLPGDEAAGEARALEEEEGAPGTSSRTLQSPEAAEREWTLLERAHSLGTGPVQWGHRGNGESPSPGDLHTSRSADANTPSRPTPPRRPASGASGRPSPGDDPTVALLTPEAIVMDEEKCSSAASASPATPINTPQRPPGSLRDRHAPLPNGSGSANGRGSSADPAAQIASEVAAAAASVASAWARFLRLHRLGAADLVTLLRMRWVDSRQVEWGCFFLQPGKKSDPAAHRAWLAAAANSPSPAGPRSPPRTPEPPGRRPAPDAPRVQEWAVAKAPADQPLLTVVPCVRDPSIRLLPGPLRPQWPAASGPPKRPATAPAGGQRDAADGGPAETTPLRDTTEAASPSEAAGEVEIALDEAEDAASASTGLAVWVLVHGFQGNPLDLRLWRAHLRLMRPTDLFVVSEVNKDDTFKDLRDMGRALAAEVAAQLKKWFGPGRKNAASRLGRLNFIGHSVGNLIIRSALLEPALAPYTARLHTYVSIAGPHLGYLYSNNTMLDAGLALMKSLTANSSLCLRQITLTDARELPDCFLYKLAHTARLDAFANILLMGAPADGYVPYHSAKILPCAASLADRDTRRGPHFSAMLAQLTAQLHNPRTRVHRVSVDFGPPRRDRPWLAAMFGGLLGRTAHLEFLETDAYLRFLIWVRPELFS